MGRIACLGWGSLVWDPRGLPTQGGWSQDGPLIPVEFARQSQDGRITLVLIETERVVPSLWVVMQCEDLAAAVEALRYREGIPQRNVDRHVCRWSAGQVSPKLIPSLSQWAEGYGLDHVIWTGLPPKFSGTEITPTAEQVVDYLKVLTGEARDLAEYYVRKAPRQIATQYRQSIEAALQWNPV